MGAGGEGEPRLCAVPGKQANACTHAKPSAAVTSFRMRSARIMRYANSWNLRTLIWSMFFSKYIQSASIELRDTTRSGW